MLKNPIANIIITEWQHLRKRKKIFLLYVLMFFIAGTITLTTPFVIGSIFNSIQKSISTKEELYYLLFKISILLLITILFWIFHGTARILEQTTGFYVKRNYINEKIKRVLELPIKWHKDNHSGDTIDKINRASNSLEEFAMHKTFDIIYGITNFIGSAVILLIIDWKIGLFAILFSSTTLFIISRIDKVLDKKYKELNKYSNKLSSVIFDYLSNIITVITLRLKKSVEREIDEKQMNSLKSFKESARINEIKWGFASIMLSLMTVMILCFRAYTEFIATGTILIGTLYMLYSYLNAVGETFYKFAYLYGDLIRINARIDGIKAIDLEYEKRKIYETINLPNNWKKISLKNISFTYNIKGKKNHLEGINLSFLRGEKIALVGESGSGKSTILSLIRGLYEIEKGKVYCDGKILLGGLIPIRKHITLIPQEPELFNNTLKYNITMGFPVQKEDILKVIKISQLKEVISKLPNGFSTNIMEKGVNLSGGEKQRLALARGLLAAKESDIILLDEPTSSVDSLNELKIHEEIFKEFSNKTIISSIHRLHLLDNFDYIYLFNKGKIISQGTFEEIKRNPTFDTMWRKYHREKIQDKELLKKS